MLHPTRSRLTASLALCLVPSLLNCADVSDAKGAEEGELHGKSDSLLSPTEMGQLRFGLSNPGELTDSQQFLAWTFELTGPAELSLETQVASNLDTVMYLFERPEGAQEWTLAEKNDDHADDTLASRIARSGQAGEYVVVVKGFKLAMRGGFTIAADCVGDGCPQAETCDVNITDKLPPETGYGESCDQDIFNVLSEPVAAVRHNRVTEEERCSLEPLESRAIELYMDYWHSVVGAPEVIEEHDGFVVEYVVQSARHDDGSHTISIDIDADEDRLYFMFDSTDELVAYVHSEQSSSAHYFCAAPTDPPSSTFLDECMLAAAHAMPGMFTSDGELVASLAEIENAPGNTPEAVQDAMALFVSETGASPEDSLEIFWTAWTGAFDEDGGVEVNIDAAGVNKSYWMTDFFFDNLVVFTEDDDGAVLSCTEIEE